MHKTQFIKRELFSQLFLVRYCSFLGMYDVSKMFKWYLYIYHIFKIPCNWDEVEAILYGF